MLDNVPLKDGSRGRVMHDHAGVDSKDYEFSRRSMEDHWRAGYHDTIRTLRHPEILERPRGLDGAFMFDLAEHGRE